RDLERCSMIADYETLKKLCKARGPGGVKAWLARNRIKYFIDSKGNPTTTLSALDRALHRGSDNNEPNFELPSWESSPAGSQSRASTKKTAATTRSSRTSGTRSPGSMREQPSYSEPYTSSTRSDPGQSENS